MATFVRTDLEFVSTKEKPAARPATSRVEAETSVCGDLEASGALEIAGRVDGDITAKSLAIEEGGRVKGEVRTDATIIAGAFSGTLRCQSVTLRKTATVKGEIHYERVAIETGASVEADFHRTRQVRLIAAE